MTNQQYSELIVKGIEGLPSEFLAEVVDFVFFLRKRALEPDSFQEELENAVLRAELKRLRGDEEVHLEREFDNYDQQ